MMVCVQFFMGLRTKMACKSINSRQDSDICNSQFPVYKMRRVVDLIYSMSGLAIDRKSDAYDW